MSGNQDINALQPRASPDASNPIPAYYQDNQALKQHVLSFDGGGIRGYSSLLILEALMKKIAELEEAAQLEVTSMNQSNGIAIHDVEALDASPIGRTSDNTSAQNPLTQLPLPCHYFDYFFGTSTGGLSAIMLGRLRMGVEDCLAQYPRLGNEIFGKPRWMHLKSPLWRPRSKYNCRKLEKLLQGIIDELVGQSETDGQLNNRYPAFEQDQSRTVVVAVKETSDDLTEFLFRTYDHRSHGNSNLRILRNPGRAYDTRIWRVARATTAAPPYFSAMNIDGSTFIDGGMGYNNPSKLARDEVTEYHRTRQDIERPIAVLLSIGTGKTGGNCGETIGRSDHYNVRRRMMAHYRRFMRDSFNRWTDGREIEADMHRLAERDGFDYYRMDAAGLGKVKLDEWKKDEATLREMRESTNIYLETEPVRESIQRLAEQLVQARKCRKLAWDWQKIEKFYEEPQRIPTNPTPQATRGAPVIDADPENREEVSNQSVRRGWFARTTDYLNPSTRS